MKSETIHSTAIHNRSIKNRSLSLIFIFTILILTGMSSDQSKEWMVKDGRARYQTVILLPERDAAFIYKQVNRWLVNKFKNPEDVLKARVEGEYLRGDVYCPKLCQLGSLSSPDFSYTFSVEIKDGKVRLTLFNGTVKFVNAEDGDRSYPIETYFTKQQKKNDRNSAKLISSVNELSASLKESLEAFLLTDYAAVDDW